MTSLPACADHVCTAHGQARRGRPAVSESFVKHLFCSVVLSPTPFMDSGLCKAYHNIILYMKDGSLSMYPAVRGLTRLRLIV